MAPWWLVGELCLAREGLSRTVHSLSSGRGQDRKGTGRGSGHPELDGLAEQRRLCVAGSVVPWGAVTGSAF